MGAHSFGNAQKTRFRGGPPPPSHPARVNRGADTTLPTCAPHPYQKPHSLELRAARVLGVAGGVGVGEALTSREPCLLRAAEGTRPHLVARMSAGRGPRVSVLPGGQGLPHPYAGDTATEE